MGFLRLKKKKGKRKGLNINGWCLRLGCISSEASVGGENAHGSFVPTSGSFHMWCWFSHLNVRTWEKRRVWAIRWVKRVSSETLATFREQVKLKEDIVFENKQGMSQQSITAWNANQPLAQPESRFLAKLIHGTSLEIRKRLLWKTKEQSVFPVQDSAALDWLAWGDCGVFITGGFTKQAEQTAVRNSLHHIFGTALGQREGKDSSVTS